MCTVCASPAPLARIRLNEARFATRWLLGASFELENREVFHDDGFEYPTEFGRTLAIEEEDPKAKKRKKKSRKKKAENEPEPPSPYDWQILEPVSVPIENGLMGSVDLETLIAMTGGSNTWDVRLVVKDANGHSRESRMSMALPRPPAQEEVASE